MAAVDVVVRDGSTVCLRQAHEGDAPALLEFLRALSRETLYYRFMSLPALTEKAVRGLMRFEDRDATSLLAEAGGRIAGFAGFYRDPDNPTRAEVAKDLVQYWAEDPRTSVILLYLESFGNPKKFSEIARRVARTKPIVAVKAGRSAAGSRAAASHTGALASSDAVVDALFRQAGVIRTERLEELFDVAALLAQQPVPRGGIEMIVGAAHDPLFGPLIACGMGGVLVDVLADTAFRLHPLRQSDAREMLDELRGARLLRGYRGSPPADEAALRDVLIRILELIVIAPEIQSSI